MVYSYKADFAADTAFSCCRSALSVLLSLLRNGSPIRLLRKVIKKDFVYEIFLTKKCCVCFILKFRSQPKRNFRDCIIDLIDYNMYLAATFGNIKTNYIY